MAQAPPRPPPHAQKTSGLPDGNYDIFIIPPHSAGGGFLYLPSLKPNINSFVAGFATAMLCVGFYNVVVPAAYNSLASLSPGVGIFFAMAAGVIAVSFSKTLTDAANDARSAYGSNFTFNTTGAGPGAGPNPGPSSQSPPDHSATSGWEKAREETRRREQERKQTEEAKAAAEAAAKKREEAEKAARAAAEKERWDQARAREKDGREKEARERIAKERAAREAGRAHAGGTKYQKPTAQSATDTGEYSSKYRHPFASSAGSVSEQSESSYAPSMSTARTTPPPSATAKDRGPYMTADANKVIIQGVFLYTSAFQKPVRMLVRGQGSVTDGLILRVTTEGLFIDDDVRGVPQREWDVKAWGIKLVEIGRLDGISVCRVTMRDTEGKRFLFVLPAEQSWKVDVGLERLRKGSQVRSMGLSTIKEPEVKAILAGVGW